MRAVRPRTRSFSTNLDDLCRREVWRCRTVANPVLNREPSLDGRTDQLQTTYLEQGTPPEAKTAKAVGERVQEWREKNELFLPNFPSKAIDSLRGSVDYPNDGSPDAAQGQDQKKLRHRQGPKHDSVK